MKNFKSQLSIALRGICISGMFLLLSSGLVAQQSGSFTDVRDNHNYRWVKVGSQTWMSDNLRFVDPAGSWGYNDDSVIVKKHGRLYNWQSAVQSCPKGWRLPSEKDWKKLIQTLGLDKAGLVIQSWDTVGIPVPEGESPQIPAFSSLLSGIRHPDGSCLNVTYWGGCWSSTQVNDSVAVNFLFVRKSGAVGESTNDKKSGFSARCIKK